MKEERKTMERAKAANSVAKRVETSPLVKLFKDRKEQAPSSDIFKQAQEAGCRKPARCKGNCRCGKGSRRAILMMMQKLGRFAEAGVRLGRKIVTEVSKPLIGTRNLADIGTGVNLSETSVDNIIKFPTQTPRPTLRMVA